MATPEEKMNSAQQRAYTEALEKIEACRKQGKRGTLLDLSGLGLTRLPPEIGQLQALTLLYLSGNQFTSLPPEIGLLQALKELSLFNNQLTGLPPEIGLLQALTQLSLSNNQLTSLPPEIGKLQALTLLSLSNNQLTDLPPEIGKLHALTELRLNYNQFTRLPPEIGLLQALTELYLVNNQLTGLPPEIGKLQALTQLYLFNNQLTGLPPEIGLLQALTRLDLSNNQLTSLPPEIGKLHALTWLWLNSNEFTVLPPEIGQLQALTELRLSDNQLTDLPSTISQLLDLKVLHVSNNQLTSLLPEVSKLERLIQLTLSKNKLTRLPSEVRALSKLEMLLLHGNPGLDLPPEVLGPTWQEVFEKNATPASSKAILDYYFAKQTQGVAPMQEVRLLMVGRGRVGKTSLLKALRGKECDEKEPETPGITVLPLSLKCDQGEATAHTWDFGGQEFLHGTHQIFLSERCVYVLVLEGRDGNWELETDYWLRFIQSFGGGSPVIVALNKYKAHAFSVDRFRLKERCPQIVGFVETDAIAGDGVDSLRDLLEQTVNGMEHVWAGVPKKYHRIKEALADTPDSFLAYKDYQALCARYEVTDEGEQESLAENLHRLGIALNFRDHQRLKHTSVLKPQWVTEGIYGLLRYAQAKDCGGVLEKSWIRQALPAKDYPTEKHGFVLELMEKFEVAFALESPNKEEAPSHWLIPELLPEVQPAAFEEFRAPGVKRLRFTYPEALPPGLLPRLIVRTHDLSTVHPEWRWRSGVVLEWNGCRALVRLDRSQRQTTVEVIGSEDEQRQGLFDIIRAHMTTLHGRFLMWRKCSPRMLLINGCPCRTCVWQRGRLMKPSKSGSVTAPKPKV